MKKGIAVSRVVAGGGALAALLIGVGSLAAQAQGQAEGDTLMRPLEGELPSAPEVFIPHPPGIEVTPYATDLEVIWSLEFAPDGRLFIAERRGNVRIVSPDGRLEEEPWIVLDSETRLEDGLLGLTLHPDFENEPWVYMFYTLAKGEELVNRVSRFREVDGRGVDEEILIDDIRSSRIHNGGRLRFGPDGMLYVAVGDVDDPMVAQDLSDPAGSLLRITPEGAVPEDNPWPGNPIWAYGLRNTNGLTFREGDGALFSADHGPSSEWRGPLIAARDEINILREGGNYGWPLAVGAPGVEEFEDPILAWLPAAPPGDLIFYYGDLMPELHGDLFFSTLRSETLMRIRFEDASDPDRPTSIERWFTTGEPGVESVLGRLRGLAVGPDGALYVGTGNHDGRSPLREGDDRVLRIAPEGR